MVGLTVCSDSWAAQNGKMKNLICSFFLVCLLAGAESRSTGAPDSACVGVSPDPAQHGAAAQTTSIPYMITGLPSGNYTPGMTYTREFSLSCLYQT